MLPDQKALLKNCDYYDPHHDIDVAGQELTVFITTCIKQFADRHELLRQAAYVI